MNENRKTFRPQDYADVFRKLEKERRRYCVFGGMAVSVWSGEYLEEEEVRNAWGARFLTTKDVDIRGEIVIAQDLQNLWEQKYQTIKWRNELKWRGYAWAIYSPDFRCVEITQKIPGLDAADKPLSGFLLKIPLADDIVIRVLDPVSCLQAKLDVWEREKEGNRQGKRNDLRHIALLAMICPRYIAELREIACKTPDATLESRRLDSLRTRLDAALAEHAALMPPSAE